MAKQTCCSSAARDDSIPAYPPPPAESRLPLRSFTRAGETAARKNAPLNQEIGFATPLDVGEVAAKHAGAHPVVRHQPAGAGRHLRDRAGIVRMAGGRGADGWFRCCSCGVLCTARPDVNGHTSSLRASGCWLAHPLMRRSTAIPHLQECLQRAPGLGPQVAAKRFQEGRLDLSRLSEERMGLS